ncbi:hypothetical protein VE04_09459, partial [Pseudogymnoascus sp. 24MN13]
MSSHAIHHALLRPCVLHILRAAGYHSTKPSVLDALTDIAGRYMHLLATSTVAPRCTRPDGAGDLDRGCEARDAGLRGDCARE